MKNSFCIDEKKEYLIYGAGGNGLKLIPVFKENGYCLKGFIDKRATSLGNVQGERVWNLEGLKELESEADNVVIIITTKNVFDHTAIVSELAKIGFRQCIYKPLFILKGYADEELEKISKAHDIFLIGGTIPEKQELAKVRDSYKMRYKDRLFISQGDANILVWMPLELLFNYKKSDVYENLSMAAFFPLDGLYRLFLGIPEEKEEDILNDFYSYAFEWAYRNQVDVTEELKASWVKSRKDSFFQMQEISEYDFEFFHRNAPQVEMGNAGRFHMLCSGRNRVVFLAAKGYRHVPVIMKPEDYEKWIHRDAFHKVQAYIEEKQVIKMFAPVPHPYLKDISAESVDYFRLVCFPIARYIFRAIYHEARRTQKGYCITDGDALSIIKAAYSVLCDMNDEGACSRYLHACGFHVNRVKNDNAFTKLLDDLFYQYLDEVENGHTGSYSLLVIDDYTRIEDRIAHNEINQIICVGLGKEEAVCLEKEGYVYERTLSRIFDANGIKLVNSYKREK